MLLTYLFLLNFARWTSLKEIFGEDTPLRSLFQPIYAKYFAQTGPGHDLRADDRSAASATLPREKGSFFVSLRYWLWS